MKTPSFLAGLVAFGAAWGWPGCINAQGFQPQTMEVRSRETAIVESACHVLTEIMAVPAKGIPKSLLADAQTTRRELAESARRLSAILDESWKKYLAVPSEVYGTGPLPSGDGLRQASTRFDRVATNPQYQSLAQRPEFQETHALLRKLLAQQTPLSPLTLPPPPDRN